MMLSPLVVCYLKYTQVSIRKLKEIHTLTHPAKPNRSS